MKAIDNKELILSLEELEKEDINETQKKEYEKELSNIIIKLARIK